MFDITDEITFTPGRLARKLGISKSKLMRHLRDTGLIEQCWLTKGGHWRIPYSLAVRISSVEALSVQLPKSIQEVPRNKEFNQKVSPLSISSGRSPDAASRNEPKSVDISLPNYAQIGRSLRRAGVTMRDLIKYIEKQMEATHGQTQDNADKVASRSEKGGNGGTANRV